MKTVICNLGLACTLIVLIVCATDFAAYAQNKSNARQGNDKPRGSSSSSSTTSTNQTNVNELINSGQSAATDDMTFVYEFEQPQFVISRVRIEHNAQGKGSITFTRRALNEDFTEPINVSAPALARIKEFVAKLNFLDSTENYQTEKDFSNLGNVTLTVKQNAPTLPAQQKTRTVKYNYTRNADAAALANEYRRLQEQALFIFDINLARTNQPLEAPGIMRRLELLVARNGISDLAQLAPTLRDLSTDERLPLIARNKAEKLLKKAEKP